MIGIPIRGKATGTPQQAYATAVTRGAKPTSKNRDFFTYLYADARTAGTNADVAVAQWDLETGGGTSYEWTVNTNPGGVGVFPDGTTAGYTFTAAQAARELITHMLVYLGVPLLRDGPNPIAGTSWLARGGRALSPRPPISATADGQPIRSTRASYSHDTSPIGANQTAQKRQQRNHQ